MAHYESPRPAGTRSQIMLEPLSWLAVQRAYPWHQVQIQIRTQGPGPWKYTVSASDTPDAIDEVARREVDIAAINPGSPLTLAYRGTGPFKEPIPVRAITVIPSLDWLGFAVMPSTGLTSVADIKSRKYPLRVSIRAQENHSLHFFLDEVFKLYGFSIQDIVSWGGTVERDTGMPFEADRFAKLKNGTVEAIFDEAVTKFIPPALELGARFLPIEAPQFKQLGDMGFRMSVIPKRMFPGLPADIPALDFSGWPVFTHVDVDEEFIYDYCRALDARRGSVAWEEPGPLPLERMCRDTPEGPLDIPLHPGAERYWREVGYL